MGVHAGMGAVSDWAATEKLHATVTLAEGIILEGQLHVMARVAHRQGPETPLEMLNRHQGFIPLSLPDGEVLFLSKSQVAMVACPVEETPELEPARVSVAQLVGLDVEMQGGGRVSGMASFELPPGKSRASDYLNFQEPFFGLVSQGAMLCIHHLHVRFVRPLN